VNEKWMDEWMDGEQMELLHWGKKNPIVDPPNQTVKEQEGKARKGGEMSVGNY